ncbi:hypothetical protein NQ315_000165 [Exocentrus adspersus]|uniref:Uncharacterized protein n=1 Tax=Exocentrus adspersus TaxID=1586481 RepID=A0AAV8VQJ3_9CUCU|nr:hypothetical protein NQ315_000165 [Exocentrus adspersus]
MSDEEYNRKLEQLQQYIPFLDNMIIQLKDPNKKNREQQLNKMQSLHAMITDKRKKFKLNLKQTLNCALEGNQKRTTYRLQLSLSMDKQMLEIVPKIVNTGPEVEAALELCP